MLDAQGFCKIKLSIQGCKYGFRNQNLDTCFFKKTLTLGDQHSNIKGHVQNKEH